MGLLIQTAASLMLVYGGAYGVEACFSRWATPEARSAVQAAASEPSRLVEVSSEEEDGAEGGMLI